MSNVDKLSLAGLVGLIPYMRRIIKLCFCHKKFSQNVKKNTAPLKSVFTKISRGKVLSFDFKPITMTDELNRKATL